MEEKYEMTCNYIIKPAETSRKSLLSGDRLRNQLLCLTDCGDIYTIYVFKKQQGQKVVYNLMNAAMCMLSEYSNIAFWVLKGNNRAIRFYEKYGFRFDDEEKKVVVGTPNTERRMILSLR